MPVGSIEESLAPLSARSVALSVLLGARPPRLSAGELTRLGVHFGIAGSTMRVALSRMTAAGDLRNTDGVYTLSERHLARQRRTDELIAPRRRQYTGMWRTFVVVSAGRPAEERQATRDTLTGHRFAQLREGVWTRPDNLDASGPTVQDTLRGFSAIPDDDHALSRELWDLAGWAREARRLLAVLRGGAAPGQRLTAAAAAVRLLRTDPVLPDELMPERWPADELRWAYEDFRQELTAVSLQAAAAARTHLPGKDES